MSGSPHDFSRGKGSVPVTAHSTYKLTCPECNWSQIIATPDAPPVLQCPLCSWDEIDAKEEGTFVSFECVVHGVVTSIVTDAASKTTDHMDTFCPHCLVRPRQYFEK